MAIFIHKFDSESAFTETYASTAYTSPWVSYTTPQNAQAHVDYNRSPYYGKGLVFDASKQAHDSYLGTQGTETEFELIYDDSEYFGLVSPNPYTEMEYVYAIDSDTFDTWRNSHDSLTLTVINAKSIDPTLDDTLELNMTIDGQTIGGDDKTAFKTTLANNRKIWIVFTNEYNYESYDKRAMFLYMNSRY